MQLVRNQSDELRIGGLAFGVGYGVAEEPLQGIQIPPVPGYLDGVADGPLDSTGGGLEGLGYLGIEYLCDGVACLTARWGGFQERKSIALFMSLDNYCLLAYSNDIKIQGVRQCRNL